MFYATLKKRSLEHYCKGIHKATNVHNCFQVEENFISVYIKSYSLLRIHSKLENLINVQKNPVIHFSVALILASNLQKSRKRLALCGYNQEILIATIIPAGLYSASS